MDSRGKKFYTSNNKRTIHKCFLFLIKKKKKKNHKYKSKLKDENI